MNLFFANNYLHLREQDSIDTVLLFFFILLPLTALFPHSHSLCAILLLLISVSGIIFYGVPRTAFRGSCALFVSFLVLCLSSLTLPVAFAPTLLSVTLRLSFFLPFIFIEKTERIFRFYATICGIIGLFSFIALLNGKGVLGYTDTTRLPEISRAAFLFGNPNVLASYLLPASLLSLYDLLFRKNGRSGCIFIFCVLGILATFSRGAILSLAVCVFLLLCLRWHPLRVFGVCLSLLPLCLFLLPEALKGRLASLGSPDSSVSYRFSLWQSIFRLPITTLLFGVGEGKAAMLETLSPVLSAGLIRIEHTHSLFLHLLLSHGAVGVLLFSILSFFALSEKKEGAFAYLSLLLFGFFDDPLYCGQTEVIFWLFLGSSQKEVVSFSSFFCSFWARFMSYGDKRRQKPSHTSYTPRFLK